MYANYHHICFVRLFTNIYHIIRNWRLFSPSICQWNFLCTSRVEPVIGRCRCIRIIDYRSNDSNRTSFLYRTGSAHDSVTCGRVISIFRCLDKQDWNHRKVTVIFRNIVNGYGSIWICYIADHIDRTHAFFFNDFCFVVHSVNTFSIATKT